MAAGTTEDEIIEAAKVANAHDFITQKEKGYDTNIGDRGTKLSGGEKRRLHLLSILFRNPNFLILEEPTNDLDLPTLGVLENFLGDYPGCLLIVSHDRYFMDRLVDHMFVFEGEGVVRDFPGNYSQYRIWLKEKEEEERNQKRPSAGGSEVVSEKPEAASQKTEAGKPEKKKLTFKEKREFEQLQQEIHEVGRLSRERKFPLLQREG